MKFHSVLKNTDNNNDLNSEYKASNKLGSIYLGKKFLFFRSGLNTYYLPYEEISRYFRRVKCIPTHICCGRLNLEIEHIVFCDKKGELAEIQLPNKKVALALMEELKLKIPNAKVGYNKFKK